MELSRSPLVVAFELSQKRKAIVADALAGASAVIYLTELDAAARAEVLRNTGVFLTFNPFKELRSGEAKLSDGARCRNEITAGRQPDRMSSLPQKPLSLHFRPMSVFGPKRTCRRTQLMSVFGGKADSA
jgi:hypothetical protein